jgi:hypothetical protein
MNRIRKIARPATQRINQPLNHRLARSCLRRAISRRQGPDELSQALTAFSRVIRSHRRLAKLAPRFFDSAVVNQEIRDRAERERWRAVWEPALNKVYGLDPDTKSHDPSDELPRLPSMRTQSVVERELAECELWMSAGKRAMTNYSQRHSQRLPTLTQIARLCNVAAKLGRMSCGFDSTQPPPPPLNYDSVWADLERAYPATVITSEGGDTL